MSATQLEQQRRSFYRRWVIANSWSEAAGLGTTFALGRVIAPALEQSSSAVAVLAGAGLAVVLGILLEGLLVGLVQAAVLRRRLARLPARSWVVATAIGAGIAWILGMVPSTIMALQKSVGAASSPATEPSATVQIALGAALGAMTGPILGLAQWTVLRQHVDRASRWLGANAVAWAVGMPLIFVGMDLAPWGRSGIEILAWGYGVCGLAGAVVGAIHGPVLAGITEHPRPGRRASSSVAPKVPVAAV